MFAPPIFEGLLARFRKTKIRDVVVRCFSQPCNIGPDDTHRFEQFLSAKITQSIPAFGAKGILPTLAAHGVDIYDMHAVTE